MNGSVGRGMGTRLRVMLLVALLFGAPAVVTATLLTTDFGSAVADGAQPGGALRGAIVDGGGRAVGGIDVELATVTPTGEHASSSSTKSAGDGTFELAAPACTGHYEIRTSGGDWQRTAQAYSFIDSKGRALEAQPLRIALRPGCRLELELVRTEGNRAVDGEFTLQGGFGDGLFFGFLKPEMKTSGTVQNGRLAITGLPPMKADIFVKISTGETIELRLELTPGINRKTIKI